MLKIIFFIPRLDIHHNYNKKFFQHLLYLWQTKLINQCSIKYNFKDLSRYHNELISLYKFLSVLCQLKGFREQYKSIVQFQ